MVNISTDSLSRALLVQDEMSLQAAALLKWRPIKAEMSTDICIGETGGPASSLSGV